MTIPFVNDAILFVRVPAGLKARITADAATRGEKESVILRDILRAHYARTPPPVSKPARKTGKKKRGQREAPPGIERRRPAPTYEAAVTRAVEAAALAEHLAEQFPTAELADLRARAASARARSPRILRPGPAPACAIPAEGAKQVFPSLIKM